MNKKVKIKVNYVQNLYNRFWSLIHSLSPKTLFARIVLLIGTTLILIQVIFSVFFYDQLWRKSRNALIYSVSQQISQTFYLQQNFESIESLKKDLNSNPLYQIGRMNPTAVVSNNLPALDTENPSLSSNARLLMYYIKESISSPIHVNEFNNDKQTIRIAALLKDNVYLLFYVEQDVFFNQIINYLISASIIAYVLFMIIIMNFFKLQLRPLNNIYKNLTDFGKGKKVQFINPSGTIELKNTAKAVNLMMQRTERFIELRTMMTSSISHDLKTCLTKMNLIIDTNEKNDSYDPLKKEIQTMSNMLHSYLDFAQQEHDLSQEEKQYSKIDINKLVEEISNSYRGLSSEGVIKININNHTRIINGHHTSIKRCIENIISNANKYAKKNIVITIYNNYNNLYLVIEDDGIGIPESEYSNVFKPFYKVNKARTANENGSVGLGMFIVKNILMKHGGNIELSKSEQLGGLKVSISLPL